MPISSAIKGLQSIKSMQNVVKSSITNKEESDFIKLYLFEKERTRLKSEEIKILQRLEIIHSRIKVIQNFYTEKSITLQNHDTADNSQFASNDEKSEWRTISIDY